MHGLSSMILHILTDKFGKILQSPSQKVMQDLLGMISPDIVPICSDLAHKILQDHRSF